jgi:hypothetical protein
LGRLRAALVGRRGRLNAVIVHRLRCDLYPARVVGEGRGFLRIQTPERAIFAVRISELDNLACVAAARSRVDFAGQLDCDWIRCGCSSTENSNSAANEYAAVSDARTECCEARGPDQTRGGFSGGGKNIPGEVRSTSNRRMGGVGVTNFKDRSHGRDHISCEAVNRYAAKLHTCATAASRQTLL